MTLEKEKVVVYANLPYLSTPAVKDLFDNVDMERLSTAPPATALNGSIYMYQFSGDEDVFGNLTIDSWSSNHLLWKCHGFKVIEKRETPCKYSLETRYYHSRNIPRWSKRVYLEQTTSSKLLLVHYKFTKPRKRQSKFIKKFIKDKLNDKNNNQSVDNDDNAKLIEISDNDSDSSLSGTNNLQDVKKNGEPNSEIDKYYFANTVFDILKLISGSVCPLCVDVKFQYRHEFHYHFEKRHYNYAVFCQIEGNQACILPCRKSCYLHKIPDVGRTRAHFHCPFCGVLFSRSSSIKQHLTTTGGHCQFRWKRTTHRIPSRVKLLNHSKASVNKDDHNSYCAPSNENTDLTDKQPTFVKSPTKNRYFKPGRGPKSLQTSSNSCGSSPDPKHAVTQSENVVNYDTEAILDPDVPQTVEIITDDQQASFSDQFNPETLKDVESSETRKNCENRQHVETQPLLDSSEDDEFAARSQEKNAMELDDSDVADSAFLLSLLPEMRLMSKRQKSHFKKITMSVLDDVLYGSGSSS